MVNKTTIRSCFWRRYFGGVGWPAMLAGGTDHNITTATRQYILAVLMRYILLTKGVEIHLQKKQTNLFTTHSKDSRDQLIVVKKTILYWSHYSHYVCISPRRGETTTQCESSKCRSFSFSILKSCSPQRKLRKNIWFLDSLTHTRWAPTTYTLHK